MAALTSQWAYEQAAEYGCTAEHDRWVGPVLECASDFSCQSGEPRWSGSNDLGPCYRLAGEQLEKYGDCVEAARIERCEATGGEGGGSGDVSWVFDDHPGCCPDTLPGRLEGGAACTSAEECVRTCCAYEEAPVVAAICADGRCETGEEVCARLDAYGLEHPVPTGGSAEIGPAGGTLALEGVTLTFPAGALAEATTVSVTWTRTLHVIDHAMFSPYYTFEPAGTQFAKPVTIAMEFDSDAANANAAVGPAALYWSRAPGSGPGFEPLASSVSGSVISAEVTHFSNGFVGAKF